MREEEQPPHGWHIRKEIQVGHLLTTLLIAASVMTYVFSIERRMALAEREIQTLHESDEMQKAANGEAIRLLRNQLDRIDAKLDRVLEERIRR